MSYFFGYYKNEECSICLQEKYLINFCENHKYCHSCCKEWLNKSFYCPDCRTICTNKDYFKYNILINNQEDSSLDNNKLELIFSIWHKPRCLRYKHYFTINEDRNNYDFYCTDCNIIQVFPKNLFSP
jgi:hypothetical protein